MAFLGDEVGDAYISVHADTSDFKRDMARLKVSSKELFDEVGTQAGAQFQKAFSKEIRGFSLKGLSKKASAEVRKMGRTIATDAKIVGAVFEDNVVRPIRRSLTRAVNQVIVSTGRAKDAVVEFAQTTGAMFSGMVLGEVDKVRRAIDNISPSLRSLRASFANTALALKDMLSTGGWDKLRDDAQLFAVHMRASGGRAVEEFRDGWAQVWDSSLMVKARAAMGDLGRVLVSGMKALGSSSGSSFQVGFQDESAGIERSLNLISDGVNKTWKKVKKDNDKGMADLQTAVSDFAGGTETAAGELEKTTRKVRGSVKKVDKDVNVKFLGRLKGSRNDAVNAIGTIGDAFEGFISGTITKGFGFLGNFVGKIGEGISNLATKSGALEKPLSALGGLLVTAGEGMGAMSATGVGLVVVIAVLIASFIAWNIALALTMSLLSALLGIVVALASSAFFALIGALGAATPLALALAAGIGAVVVAMKGMSDEQKAAFDPLKETFKEMSKVVSKNLFGNLAAQLEIVKRVLTDFVSPLLAASAQALSDSFDNFLTGLQSPSVQESLGTMRDVLPGVLKNLTDALGDFVLGLLNLFGPLSEKMGPLSGKIKEIADQFLRWTENPENRQKLLDFFDRGIESLETWIRLLKPLTDAVLGLFTQGKDTGDTFVGKLVEIITQFANWVNSKEGRETLKRWFEDAKRIATDLAGAIETISVMIDRLDTPENRQALSTLLQALNHILIAAAAIAGWFSDIPTLIKGIAAVVFRITGLEAAYTSVKWVYDKLAELWDLLNKIRGGPSVTYNGPAGGGGGRMNTAKTGRIVNSPTTLLTGEAGREMVVPLTRPLNQVDPAVRAVSAFARGMDTSRFNSGFSGANGPAKVVNISAGAIQVAPPTDDPELTANAVLDRLVARMK